MSRRRPSVPPTFARRGFLTIAGIAALWVGPIRTSRATGDQPEAIAQPQNPDAAGFMERAYEMRQAAIDLGDQAYGAVIVRDDLIVGQSWSRVVIDGDPTGHAEMAAIRDAARRLGSRDLSGTMMYSTSRPCPMCEAAAYWANIDGMIHGQNLNEAGAPRLCR